MNYFIILRGQHSEVGLSDGLKALCWLGCVPFWRLQGQVHTSAFPARRGHPHSSACGPLPSSSKSAIVRHILLT